MSHILNAVAVVGIDIGKNSLHIVGHGERGAFLYCVRNGHGQVEARQFATKRVLIFDEPRGEYLVELSPIVNKVVSNGL